MRLALKILGVILILGILFLAFLLVPAHLQVRSVEPGLPSEADLRSLLSETGGPTRLRYITTSSQKMPVGELGHVTFVAEWANGNLFMIDAGMDAETARSFGELIQTMSGGGEVVSRGSIDELLGAETQRVMGVAFTHLHIDHTQGTIPFCVARGEGAKLYQTHWQADLHNFNTTESAALLAESCLAPGTMTGDVIQRIEGFPGLGIVALGGHTPGSTLFAIAVEGRLWLLSGDISNSKADLTANKGKGILYSYFFVPEHVARNEQLRLWLADLDARGDITVLVSHDLLDIQASGLGE